MKKQTKFKIGWRLLLFSGIFIMLALGACNGDSSPKIMLYNVKCEVIGEGLFTGIVTPSLGKAKSGTVITLTFIYSADITSIRSVSVKDTKGATVAYNAQSRTFTMPKSDVTVTVTFAEKTEPHTITLQPMANGTLQSSHQEAEEGMEVTITVKPNEEYLYVEDSFAVTKASGGAVNADRNGLVFTFTMPGEAVTVKAAFIKEGAPPLEYIEEVELDLSGLEIPSRDGDVPSISADYARDGSVFTATLAIEESEDGAAWTDFSGSAYTVDKFVKFVFTLKAEEGYLFANELDISAFNEFIDAEEIDGFGTDTLTFSYFFPIKIGQPGDISISINVEADFEGFPEEIIVEAGSDVTIELEQYEEAKWFVSGELKETGGSYTLKAEDFPKPNIYSLTMVVTINGREYSKIVDFEVK